MLISFLLYTVVAGRDPKNVAKPETKPDFDM